MCVFYKFLCLLLLTILKNPMRQTRKFMDHSFYKEKKNIEFLENVKYHLQTSKKNAECKPLSILNITIKLIKLGTYWRSRSVNCRIVFRMLFWFQNCLQWITPARAECRLGQSNERTHFSRALNIACGPSTICRTNFLI